MTGNDTTDKLRSLFLAVLMATSVFAGSIAFAGTAAANAPDSGNYAANSFQGDETSNVTAVSGENTEIADLSFDNPGTIDRVTVNVSYGTNSTNLSSGDIDSVTVVALNDSEVLAERSVDTSQLNTTVDFNGTDADTGANGTVDRVQVLATIAGSQTVDGDEVIDAGVEIFASDGTSFSGESPYDTQGTQSVTTRAGYISGEVEDTNGDPIENATVEIINADSGAVAATLKTDSTGEFDPSRVRVAPGNNYTVNVERFGFTSFSQTKFVASGDTVFLPVTLSFNLRADTLRVERFDGSSATGSTQATLLANGESSNTAQYVAILENSSVETQSTPIDSSAFTGEDINLIFNDTAGVGDFVDNNAIDNQITVTTNTVADVDDDGYEESYVVFEVTADNATTSALGASPLAEEQINATYAEQGLTNKSATVQYVNEGEEAITGEVLDNSGDPVEGATVWAAYQGTNQSLDFSTETFVNEDGEAFLVGTTDADGRYVIPGLAGENTSVNLYVDAAGFNRLNMTSSSVGEFVAAADVEETAGTGAETENHDFVLTAVDVNIVDYRFNITVADSGDNLAKDVDVPTGQERTVRVEVEELTSTSTEYRAAANQNINLSLTNISAGTLSDTMLTTDTNGVATTTFTAGLTDDATNVTASTQNASDTQFSATGSEQAHISVFGTGILTGDILDQDENPIEGATVRLLAQNTTTGQFEVIRNNRTISDATQYAFSNLRTDRTYRVEAYFGGDDGFATITGLQPGTNTRDVVIDEAVAPTLSVSNLNPTDATITQGDNLTVSATLTNDGTGPVTQEIELRLDGTVIASLNETVPGGSSEEVIFTVSGNQTADLAAGDYTHGIFSADDGVEGTLTVQENSNGNNSNGLTGIAAQYDANENGDIGIGELGVAASDYANDEITIIELSTVAGVYAS